MSRRSGEELGEITAGPGPGPTATVYLAEDPAAVQFGYLPRPLAEALAWMEPVDPPGHRRQRLRAVEDDGANG